MSRKTMLAVEAVLDIAFYGRADPVQAKEITARQGVPQRHLEQVMQQLVHVGVLKGYRGPRGGYTLARERRRITVAEIARIVSELENSEEREAISNSALGTRIVGPLWSDVERMLLQRLESVTIEDLLRDAEQAGIRRGPGDTADFAI